MLSDPRKVDDAEPMVETARGLVPMRELAERVARPELHEAADAVVASTLRTVELSRAELLALDELIAAGASIMLRTRGYAFPRELASAHRKLQLAAVQL